MPLQLAKPQEMATFFQGLPKNDVISHDHIWQEAKKVTATGTVKEVDGKKELTAEKIE